MRTCGPHFLTWPFGGVFLHTRNPSIFKQCIILKSKLSRNTGVSAGNPRRKGLSNLMDCNVMDANGIFYWISWTLESDESPFPSTVLLCCQNLAGPTLPLLNLPTPNPPPIRNQLRCRSPRDLGGFQPYSHGRFS